MKKSFLSKILSLIIATASLLALTSCSAMDKGNNMAADGLYYEDMSEVGTLPSDIDPEDYGKLIENKWISTSDEPTSTFSSDVDTASYTRFRAFVNQNASLKTLQDYYGASIRTEEMLNYFKYTTNAPIGDDLFGVRTEIAPCPWNETASLLMMTFKAKEVSAENKGNNLVFLIDVSGSMDSQDKLPLLKKAFGELVKNLSANDRISIVTYSGAEKVVLEGCKGSDKDKILKAVNSLGAGGSTNGSAGMEKAYSIARDHYIEGGNNRIIMATDGDLNVGISTTDGILEFVEEKRKSGIYISTLGFGTGGYNDSILETIADNGNGAYYFIDSMSEVEKVFGSDLLSTLYTVAEDVKFQITFDPRTVSEYRLVGYENRLMNNEDFENDAKDAGEVGSGHELVVCYEIKTTDTEDVKEQLATLKVRYKDPGALEANENAYTITHDVYTEDPSQDLKFASAVIVTSMVLHRSEYLDEGIDMEYVSTTLNSIDTSDYYKKEFKQLVGKLTED